MAQAILLSDPHRPPLPCKLGVGSSWFLNLLALVHWETAHLLPTMVDCKDLPRLSGGGRQEGILPFSHPPPVREKETETSEPPHRHQVQWQFPESNLQS